MGRRLQTANIAIRPNVSFDPAVTLYGGRRSSVDEITMSLDMTDCATHAVSETWSPKDIISEISQQKHNRYYDYLRNFKYFADEGPRSEGRTNVAEDVTVESMK